ncbi:MAG: DUF4870 domain-containing protein [Phycisphaerae bacterium]
MTEKDLGKTSTGLQANVEALLSYAFGWVTGLVFFLIETENKFVRFHALQSLITFGILTAAYIILGVFSGIFAFIGFYFILPVISIIYSLLAIGGVVVWIILMVKAYQGEYFKLPVIGDITDKNIAK